MKALIVYVDGNTRGDGCIHSIVGVFTSVAKAQEVREKLKAEYDNLYFDYIAVELDEEYEVVKRDDNSYITHRCIGGYDE